MARRSAAQASVSATATPTRARSVRNAKNEAAAIPTPVIQDLPSRRGRPARATRPGKSDPSIVKDVEPTTPGRRGRPRKEETTTAVPKDNDKSSQQDAPKRRGRPAKAADLNTSKRLGRPSKGAVSDSAAQTPSKRRGRPPKSAISTTAGASRVTKRGPAVPSIRALPPHLRSRLRKRVPKKEIPVVAEQVVKKKDGRGRPKGSTAAKAQEQAQAKAQAKTQAKIKTKTKGARTARTSGVTKPAPRRRRGFINLDVPKKYAAQVQQYLLDLEAADLTTTEAASAPEAAADIVEVEAAVQEAVQEDVVEAVEDLNELVNGNTEGGNEQGARTTSTSLSQLSSLEQDEGLDVDLEEIGEFLTEAANQEARADNTIDPSSEGPLLLSSDSNVHQQIEVEIEEQIQQRPDAQFGQMVY